MHLQCFIAVSKVCDIFLPCTLSVNGSQRLEVLDILCMCMCVCMYDNIKLHVFVCVSLRVACARLCGVDMRKTIKFINCRKCVKFIVSNAPAHTHTPTHTIALKCVDMVVT